MYAACNICLQEAQSWAAEERQKLQQQTAATAEKEAKARELLESGAANVDPQMRQLREQEAAVKLSQQQFRLAQQLPPKLEFPR